jgi:hypothetical protein
MTEDLLRLYMKISIDKTFSHQSEAGSLYKNSCLAPALRVTKFTIVTDMILATLCCAT